MHADIPGGLLIRSYRDGDERAILGLFNRYFAHSPRSREHFHWKYRNDPFGNERISLAFAGAQLVGHYAGYAVPFRLHGKDLLAHQIGDTMTEQSVRHLGRGPTSVLGQTALDFYDRFCENKVAFNYGFNVANIQKFSLQFLRSDRVEAVTYRVAPPPKPLKRVSRWMRGYSFELVREVGEEFDDLFARVEGAYPFCVKRNAAYLRWRYLARPDVPYLMIAVRKWRKLVGWIVCRIEEKRFVWGDALFDPQEAGAVEMTLRHVVPSHHVQRMDAWFPPRPQWFDETLTELGFLTMPQPDDLSLMCVPFTLAGATAQMREELYYSWGDSDLF